MNVVNIIEPERIDIHVDANSKKRALEHISQLISAEDPAMDPVNIFDSLIAREKLGSTGVGQGVAIPHGRMKSCTKPIGAFIRLTNAIDFDAIDNKPVDLLFALLVPEESTDEHLQILASLAEMFSNNDFREKMHEVDSSTDVFKLLSEWSALH
ncbi:MAG: PTS IIA-like nitrogen regulatory protein PtsN [Gammaproteobacteria bacterium]|nr:PTS IIA-like nitrogen regulatory protein PtsN [Gammaproteobacteria bacterium]